MHRVAGKERLEYPIGKVLYETSGWLQDPRFSPDGSAIAFIDHPGGGDAGAVAIVDRAGKKTELAAGFATVQGLAWRPGGREIFFTAARQGIQREVFAVTPSGKLRLVRTMQGTPALFDLAGSNALVTEDDYRSGTLAFLRDPRRPGISAGSTGRVTARFRRDGSQFLFDETGEGGGASGSVYLRATDGAPALRLGEGIGMDLSPDGAWALTRIRRDAASFSCRSSAGQPRAVPAGDFARTPFGAFFRMASVSCSRPPRRARDAPLRPIDRGGKATAISAEGDHHSRLSVSPDGALVAAIGPDRRSTCTRRPEGPSIDLAESQVGDYSSGWTADGKGLYVSRSGSSCRVDVIDIASGRRTHVRDLPAATLPASLPSAPPVSRPTAGS